MDIYKDIQKSKLEYNNIKEKLILEMDREEEEEFNKNHTKKKKKALNQIFYGYKKTN